MSSKPKLTDLDLIRFYFKRSNYDEYSSYIDRDLLTREPLEFLNSIKDFYTTNPEAESIDPEAFKTWFLQFKARDNDKEVYQVILTELINRPELSQEIILREMVLKHAGKQLLELANRGIDSERLKQIADKIDASSKKEDEIEEARLTKTIDECLVDSDFSTGFKWPLPCMNENIHPMPDKGVFMVLAGRPESGKSSMCLAFAAAFAKQMRNDDVILWFNNESIKERAQNRAACAILNRSIDELIEASKAGHNVHDYYLKEMGGVNRFEFFDIQGKSNYFIERVAKRYKKRVKLIVVDMLDNVNLTKQLFSNNNESKTMNLEVLYQWFLGISCKYASVIGTSQINVLKGDPRYPKLEDLANSKTGKQGAATVQLMVGRTPGSNIRYLSTPKNKYGAGGTVWHRAVQFYEKTCQVKEI